MRQINARKAPRSVTKAVIIRMEMHHGGVSRRRARCRMGHWFVLVLPVMLLSAAHYARIKHQQNLLDGLRPSPIRPDELWPKAASAAFDTATCGPQLRMSSALSVHARKGDAAGAARAVREAFRLAHADWGCGAASGSGWGGAAWGARAVQVSVDIDNADCVTPSCYTEDSDERWATLVWMGCRSCGWS